MKGHIAFCPHFHQPHFQLHRTREEAARYSYEPWLKLLSEAAELPGFYINIHYSGPFLYWMRSEKPGFAPLLRRLISDKKVGILGGLADEPFIQLSSRPDDVLYQLQEYDNICHELLGVKAHEWQGIHIVERESGELLLHHLSRAARRLGANPIYYLDADSYYGSHFNYPGGSEDYCLKHFGFSDPVAKTTYSHMPQDLLYYPMRDELGGESFISIPVHTQHRYQLLKRQAFTADDRIRVKPSHYLFYIRDAMRRAWELSRRMGRAGEPIVLIFEDAEKFGQWSKDPKGDHAWLMEFFRLVERDPEIYFTGLRDYVEQQGVYDTYPIGSSHAYPEWENWTAKRGVRGICFGDERLRRVLSRLRQTESIMQGLEEGIVKRAASPLAEPIRRITEQALLQSSERFQLVETCLREETRGILAAYQAINRIRHLVYQEDPKWASRHPSYGSSPYYDVNGLAYLELADRLLLRLYEKLELSLPSIPLLQDWDQDGIDEVWLQGPYLSLSIDREGGCINYLHVLDREYGLDTQRQLAALEQDIMRVDSYTDILRHSTPLVLSEADSSLCYEAYAEGGRRELCRNSMRCDLVVGTAEDMDYIDDFGRGLYELDQAEIHEGKLTVRLSRSVDHADTGRLYLEKTFIVGETELEVRFKASCEKLSAQQKMFLCPQIVCTATPSDEVHFRPEAWVCFPGGEQPLRLEMLSYDCDENSFTSEELCWDGRIDYLYSVHSGRGSRFNNRISYFLESANEIKSLEIEPAVRHYYAGLVFPEQSRLSYNSSGLMLRPVILFRDGLAEFSLKQSWQLDDSAKLGDYATWLPLLSQPFK